MKFTPLGLLIAGAGFATVNASPLRVTIVTSNVETFGQFGNLPPNVPHGIENIALTPEAELHVLGWKDSDGPPEYVQFLDPNRNVVSNRRKPCASMRGKAIQISNSLRNMFGLMPIDPEHLQKDHSTSSHRHHEANGAVGVTYVGRIKNGEVVAQGRHRHANHHHSFLQRFSRVFVTLKWWEGGAVAFVFGCGLGVLLRLVFVMAVVSYRVGFRGESVDEICDDPTGEETVVLLAPPQYTETAAAYPEEKEVPAA